MSCGVRGTTGNVLLLRRVLDCGLNMVTRHSNSSNTNRRVTRASSVSVPASGSSSVSVPAQEKSKSKKRSHATSVHNHTHDDELKSSLSQKRRVSGTTAPPPPTTTTTTTSSYFLMKSEADVFSIDDLAQCKDQTEPWDGVRNHQAKKIMMSMKKGDVAFFWASNTKLPGIVGLVTVSREAYPDETQFDRASTYFDPKATREKPIWYNVDVTLKEKFDEPILLSELKLHQHDALASMPLFTMKRLSVQPVPESCWEYIMKNIRSSSTC